MKPVENKVFIYPIGTRLWNVFATVRKGDKPIYRCWGVNGRIVSGWIKCDWAPGSGWRSCDRFDNIKMEYNCPTGRKLALLSGDRVCICNDLTLLGDGGSNRWATENVLRQLAANGQLSHYRVGRPRMYRHISRLPKIWEELKDKLVKVS